MSRDDARLLASHAAFRECMTLRDGDLVCSLRENAARPPCEEAILQWLQRRERGTLVLDGAMARGAHGRIALVTELLRDESARRLLCFDALCFTGMDKCGLWDSACSHATALAVAAVALPGLTRITAGMLHAKHFHACAERVAATRALRDASFNVCGALEVDVLAHMLRAVASDSLSLRVNNRQRGSTRCGPVMPIDKECNKIATALGDALGKSRVASLRICLQAFDEYSEQHHFEAVLQRALQRAMSVKASPLWLVFDMHRFYDPVPAMWALFDARSKCDVRRIRDVDVLLQYDGERTVSVSAAVTHFMRLPAQRNGVRQCHIIAQAQHAILDSGLHALNRSFGWNAECHDMVRALWPRAAHTVEVLFMLRELRPHGNALARLPYELLFALFSRIKWTATHEPDQKTSLSTEVVHCSRRLLAGGGSEGPARSAIAMRWSAAATKSCGRLPSAPATKHSSCVTSTSTSLRITYSTSSLPSTCSRVSGAPMAKSHSSVHLTRTGTCTTHTGAGPRPCSSSALARR